MREELINALRETAQKIDVGMWGWHHYEWTSITHCNCGLLAASICGVSPRRLDTSEMQWSWKYQAQICEMSGKPMPKVIQKLIAVGMSVVDVGNLEFLADKAILKRAGIDASRPKYYRIRENAAAYMRAWADILEEENAKKPLVIGEIAAVEEGKELVEA